MDHFPTAWGKPRDDSIDPYATFPSSSMRMRMQSQETFKDGVQRTQQPIVTGTSVLGLKFKGGVILAADMLASYGSLARFKDIQRLHPVGDHTIIGAGGDMSDFQHVQRMLQSLMIKENLCADGHVLSTPQLFSYLSRVMYQRRSKIDPLWNSFVVGGVDRLNQMEPFLAYVDLLGTTYQAPSIATGFGSYIAIPLLRRVVDETPGGEKELSEEKAREAIETCMKVLFYRDARSLNKYQIATVTAEGVKITGPLSAPTEWGFAESLRGYGAQTQ